MWESAASNADGARLVQEGRYDAAFAGEFAAATYGLEPLVTEIHDARERADPLRAGRPPRPARGADRRGQDVRGDLASATTTRARCSNCSQEFAVRGVNLMLLQSRPTGEGIGNYCFCDRRRGAYRRPPGGRGPDGAEADLPEGAVPGSYPRADIDRGGRRPARPGTSDAEFMEAAEWLARCQDGRF